MSNYKLFLIIVSLIIGVSCAVCYNPNGGHELGSQQTYYFADNMIINGYFSTKLNDVYTFFPSTYVSNVNIGCCLNGNFIVMDSLYSVRFQGDGTVKSWDSRYCSRNAALTITCALNFQNISFPIINGNKCAMIIDEIYCANSFSNCNFSLFWEMRYRK